MTDVREVRFGSMTFHATRVAMRVHIVIRAEDQSHAGSMSMSLGEWQEFVRDAERLGVARTIATHWRDQEGVNAAIVDELAELFRVS